MNSSFPNRWPFSYLKFTKYVTNIIAEPKYKYGQQEQVTVRNHNRSTANPIPNPIPVHSLMLSSHLFFCLPLLLAPFTVPCRIVFAMPEDLEMWPYHLSFRFFTMVRRSSCTPIAFWILLRTSSLVTLSL